MSGIDCVQYVIMHKECEIEQDDLYRGLCVGGLRKEGMLCELDGDNIAEYNDRINECTGLYWMWANTDSEYVGLCHYRRNFCNNRVPGDGSRLDRERIQEILCDWKYDIILSNPLRFGWRVYDNLCGASSNDLARKAYGIIHEELEKKHPDYVDVFNSVMNGHYMYLCNMFVTSRKIMNEYCEWLFSFIVDAADRLDVSECTAHEKRCIGMCAEIMLTVWISKQRYKVAWLPIHVKEGM